MATRKEILSLDKQRGGKRSAASGTTSGKLPADERPAAELLRKEFATLKGTGALEQLERLIEAQRHSQRTEPADGMKVRLQQHVSRVLGQNDVDRIQKHAAELAREREDSRKREEQTLEVLRAIQRELADERKQRKSLELLVEKHEEELELYRTGAPGRPGSSHLVVDEFKKRAARGEVEGTLADQSRVLAQWLRNAHPQAHPITPGRIENVLRIDFSETRKSTKRRRKSR